MIYVYREDEFQPPGYLILALLKQAKGVPILLSTVTSTKTVLLMEYGLGEVNVSLTNTYPFDLMNLEQQCVCVDDVIAEHRARTKKRKRPRYNNNNTNNNTNNDNTSAAISIIESSASVDIHTVVPV